MEPCRVGHRCALGDLDRGADDGAEAGHDAHSHSDAHRNAASIAADGHPDAHADGDESTDRRPDPSATSAPRPTLSRGDSGPRVRKLQERLSDLGYWLETPDGSFGALTQQAVYALQKAAGIRRDGVVGPKTTRALADRIPSWDDIEGDGVEIDLRQAAAPRRARRRRPHDPQHVDGKRRGVHLDCR